MLGWNFNIHPGINSKVIDAFQLLRDGLEIFKRDDKEVKRDSILDEIISN